MEKPREMEITKLIEVKSCARTPRPENLSLTSTWAYDPFSNQGRVCCNVTYCIITVWYAWYSIDSKPELLKVSGKKGPILQKSHPPG